MKVYVASSWRNAHYVEVIGDLRRAGHTVWDWRNPPTGGTGFRWQDAGMDDYKSGDKIEPAIWRKLLDSQAASAGYASDLAGMHWCDVGVLLHPCGRSAHLEAGWIAGRGKKVHVLALEEVEPDLMVLLLNGSICATIPSLIRRLEQS